MGAFHEEMCSIMLEVCDPTAPGDNGIFAEPLARTKQRLSNFKREGERKQEKKRKAGRKIPTKRVTSCSVLVALSR